MTTRQFRPVFPFFFLILLSSSLLSGCSSFIRKVGVGTTADFLYLATDDITTEKNWEMFKDGTPGNLKMMEGLLFLQPENANLLVSLAKGYAGMAFVVNETLALEEQYADNGAVFHKNQAILNYSKGMEFGLRYLSDMDIHFSDLQKKVNEEGGIPAYLEQKLTHEKMDLEAVMFTAQSLGSLINLQRTNMSLVAQLPVAKGLFDWVCAIQPDINYGACGIFYGAYEAGRPKMLGGDPQKGKKIFLDTIQKFPGNSLIRAAYIQYFLVPQMDIDGYKEQKAELDKAQKNFDEQMSWSVSRTENKENHEHDGLCVFKSLGLKRFEIIKKYEKKIF